MNIRIAIAVAVFVVSLVAAAFAQDAADLVLRNGKIVTVDPGNPEAQALAARDGLVIAVGSNQDVSAYVGSTTKVIDLGGALAIPGFIEGHAHFMGIGSAQMQLKLGISKDWNDII